MLCCVGCVGGGCRSCCGDGRVLRGLGGAGCLKRRRLTPRAPEAFLLGLGLGLGLRLPFPSKDAPFLRGRHVQREAWPVGEQVLLLLRLARLCSPVLLARGASASGGVSSVSPSPRALLLPFHAVFVIVVG